MLLLVGMVWEGGWVDKMARFVKVYRSHKLCRNVCSHNSYGNASGISHAYKGRGNAICHFLNIVQECQNFALIFKLVPLK